MFTGLIEDVGSISRLDRGAGGALIAVSHSPAIDDLKEGDSVAVDGVCLTVTEVGSQSFSVDASAETMRRSTLRTTKLHQKVNLERALRFSDRLGGHLVTGHVDEVGTIARVMQEGNAWKITITITDKSARYLVEKGSVAVDGISLTVNEVEGDRFSVTIIPHTALHTLLTGKQVGDSVNIETDIIGKYLDRLITQEPGRKIDLNFLSEHGFL
jgi:riboflavin synthase